jgi:hypothetical protein
MTGIIEKYPMEKVVEVLTTVVECRGNMLEASRQTKIPYVTLRKWTQETYADRYRQIEERYGQEIEQQIVMEARQTAQLAAQATRRGVEKTLKDIESGHLRGRELAQATYALAKIMGTNVDKVLTLTGRPTNPGKGSVQDALGIVRELEASGLIKVTNQAQPAIEGKADDER